MNIYVVREVEKRWLVQSSWPVSGDERKRLGVVLKVVGNKPESHYIKKL